MNIIQGKQQDEAVARHFLNEEMEGELLCTLQKGALDPNTVIDAADTLSHTLNISDVCAALESFGIQKAMAETMVMQAKRFLSRQYLEQKLLRELGHAPFAFQQVEDGVQEKYQPLGVLTHISAGNAAGLPAFSVLEGLITGNINILKLPGSDDGLSTTLLTMLIEIEPKLAEYIYVFDLPSTDVPAIKKMLSLSDAVAVWGSDFAVSGIRSIAPPNIKIIEWGHKLSFCCVTKKGETPQELEEIAKDICETEQLLCSSPQCVYFETDSFEELLSFAERFEIAMEKVSKKTPMQSLEQDVQAEITALLALISMEELLEDKKVIRGDGWNILVDNDPALRASPKFRNIWVKPMREDFFAVLRKQKGYLQTVAVACHQDELDELANDLYKCGVCRVVPCGAMTSNYSGEPHDGYSALQQYVKTIVCKR